MYTSISLYEWTCCIFCRYSLHGFSWMKMEVDKLVEMEWTQTDNDYGGLEKEMGGVQHIKNY